MWSDWASPADTVAYRTDEVAITHHLEQVERMLRARTAPEGEHAEMRARLLDELHRYRLAGIYPHNPGLPAHPRRVLQPAMYDGGPDAVPIFVDSHGHPCAVADLVLASGAADLAWRVVAEANTAWLHDMDVAGLADWVAGSGFTLDELAAIQPAYLPPEPWPRFAGTCDIEGLRREAVTRNVNGNKAKLPGPWQDCLARELATEQNPRRVDRIVELLDDFALPASTAAAWESAAIARLVPVRPELLRPALQHVRALQRLPGRAADAVHLVTALTPSMDELLATTKRRDADLFREWCVTRSSCWAGGDDRQAACVEQVERCTEEAEAWEKVSLVPPASPPPPPPPPLPPLDPPSEGRLVSRVAGWWPALLVALGGAVGALARARRRS